MAAPMNHEKNENKVIKSVSKQSNEKRLIVVLERASLESVKVGKQFELLNCDKHKGLVYFSLRITHQCLLMLMDSPLNRAGLLQVYVHTEKNVLIEINPQTRIPRTFDRFCGLMVQLLHKYSIHAADGPQKLLKVIKNPVSDHLPLGCKKYGTSFHVEKVTDPREIVPEKEPAVVVIGALSHGSVDVDYIEDTVSISSYPLSAALTCAKICSAFEEKWNVV
ncbi:ribosomal RNA small subunit methyltransferase NEP1-like [Saccostrea cucullata]|uniref:ribosomal RNA small subunit methyltransferase NEP1-like n=1 Tax=Saccostrea cuccullata TaxID=36930 RepID=UPI002ED2468A